MERKREVYSADIALNDLMEIDHVIAVYPDGTIADAPRGVYAPEVYWSGGEVDYAGADRAGWSLIEGYSGQEGYSGPIMHPSEYIGGSLETHIRQTPGYFAAIVVTDLDAEEGEDDAAGWAVAYKSLPEITL